MEILDYLKWRGDLLFTERKLNEVDNLIFSELVYFDFGQIMLEDEEITITEAYSRYVKLKNPTTYFVNNPVPLLKKCANTKRYRNIVVSEYKDCLDKKNQIQYGSVIFKLPNDTMYVAFRGTDSNIIGWKEDFNLVYMEVTPAQEMAKEYLEEVFIKHPRKFFVGGHSKGGNLAIYAAAFCNKAMKNMILGVFSNDGPGFNSLVINQEEFQAILPKVTHFMPYDSVVGIMLDTGKKSKIVESTGKNGVDQHDPYTWVVERDRFKKSRKEPKVGSFLDDTVQGWITMTDAKERQKVIDKIFEVIDELDADTLEELSHNKFLSITSLIRIAATQDKNVKRHALKTIGDIIKSGTNVIASQNPLNLPGNSGN